MDDRTLAAHTVSAFQGSGIIHHLNSEPGTLRLHRIVLSESTSHPLQYVGRKDETEADPKTAQGRRL
jgi:hypothetical protein